MPAFFHCSHRQARNAVWEHVRSCEAPSERRRPERRSQGFNTFVERTRAQYISVGLEALDRVLIRLSVLIDRYRAGHGSTDVFAKRYRTTERRTEGSFHETETKKRSILPNTTKDGTSRSRLTHLPQSLSPHLPLPLLDAQRGNNPRALQTLIHLLPPTMTTTINPDFARTMRVAIEPGRMVVGHEDVTVLGGLQLIFALAAVLEVVVGSLDKLVASPRPPAGSEVRRVRADPGIGTPAEAELEAAFCEAAGADGSPGEVGARGVGQSEGEFSR